VRRFPSLFVLFIAFACNIVAPSLAMAGGFPSRPSFQSLDVGSPTTFGKTTGHVWIAHSATPEIGFYNTGAPANNRASDVYVGTDGTIHYRWLNDAGGSAADWLTVARTANATTGATLAGPLSVTASTAATGITSSNASSARVIINDTGGTTNALVEFQTAGVAKAFVGLENITGTGACGPGVSTNDICIRATGGTTRVSKDSGGSSKPIPRMWATACTSSGSQGASIDATCSRSSLGIYVATFSNGNPTICTISPSDGANSGYAKTTGAPGSTVNITTLSTAGALADLGWSLVCWGI
jgi:hypothetical protein